jgi:hypothetical protein
MRLVINIVIFLAISTGCKDRNTSNNLHQTEGEVDYAGIASDRYVLATYFKDLDGRFYLLERGLKNTSAKQALLEADALALGATTLMPDLFIPYTYPRNLPIKSRKMIRYRIEELDPIFDASDLFGKPIRPEPMVTKNTNTMRNRRNASLVGVLLYDSRPAYVSISLYKGDYFRSIEKNSGDPLTFGKAGAVSLYDGKDVNTKFATQDQAELLVSDWKQFCEEAPSQRPAEFSERWTRECPQSRDHKSNSKE